MNAEEWNKRYSDDQAVIVTLDDGIKWETRTRSHAWRLGHGQSVVLLIGKSGGYDLARIKAKP